MVIKKNLFENLSIAGLIIVTLAFHDKTKLMVFFQIFAFVIQIINNIDNTRFKFNFLLKKYLNWELLFILYCFFSYFWSLNSGTLFNWLISLFQVIIIGISIIMYCNSNERITNVYKYMMLSCFVLVIRLLILVPLDVWGNGERIGLYIGSDSSGGYGNTS